MGRRRRGRLGRRLVGHARLSLGLQKRYLSDFYAKYVKGLFGENRRRKSMVEEEDEDKWEEDEEW